MANTKEAAQAKRVVSLPDQGVISFTGFRRTGKTEVSKLVAQRLGFPLYDTDQIFATQYNITIAAFVKTSQWIGFRRAESGIIMDLFSTLRDRAVVSLGGGALAHMDSDYLRELNIKTVKGKGLVAYLLPSPDLEQSARILTERQLRDGEDPNRPPLPQDDPRRTSVFEQTYATLRDRHPFYLEACNGFVVYEYDKSGPAEQMISQKADEVIKGMAARLRR